LFLMQPGHVLYMPGSNERPLQKDQNHPHGDALMP